MLSSLVVLVAVDPEGHSAVEALLGPVLILVKPLELVMEHWLSWLFAMAPWAWTARLLLWIFYLATSVVTPSTRLETLGPPDHRIAESCQHGQWRQLILRFDSPELLGHRLNVHLAVLLAEHLRREVHPGFGHDSHKASPDIRDELCLAAIVF
jgi:hypothetical protein